MRWIVASSLRFRFLVVAAAARSMFFGVARAPDEKVDVFPEFAPPRVEIQTACLGLSASEVEELVTVPLEHALNGVAGRGRRSARSRCRSCRRSTLLFKRGTDILQGAPARPGAAGDGRADAADVGGAAVHDAAGLGDQPDHEDRPVVEVHRPDGPVDDRRTGRSGRGCCACPAWPTSRSGASGCRQCRSASTRSGCAPQQVSLDQVMEVTARRARRRAPAVLRRRGDRHRRVRRDAEPAHRASRTSRRSDRRATWPRSRSPAATGASCASATWRRSSYGHAAADRRRGHQRRPGPAARRREAPGREHARGHQGRRGRARATCGPACPGVADRLDDLPARRASSRSRSTT